MCFRELLRLLVDCARCIYNAALACFDWLSSILIRVCDNYSDLLGPSDYTPSDLSHADRSHGDHSNSGTFSSTIEHDENVDYGAALQQQIKWDSLESGNKHHSNCRAESPPEQPKTPPAEVSPLHQVSILSTVDEERSSQISPDNVSRKTIQSAASDILDIVSSQLDEENDKASKETKSPRKEQGRKPDYVHLDTDSEVSFTVVGERKPKPLNKEATKSSASPAKVPPKKSPPKKIQIEDSTSNIQVRFTNRPTRSVDGSISYAQITSGSPESTVEIGVAADTESALLALKEPEPSRSTQEAHRPTYLSRQDSVESISEGPVIFQTESIVHRAAEPVSPERELSVAGAQPQDSGVVQITAVESHKTPEESEEGSETQPELVQSTSPEREVPKETDRDPQVPEQLEGNLEAATGTVAHTERSEDNKEPLKSPSVKSTGEGEQTDRSDERADADFSPIDPPSRNISQEESIGADDEFSEIKYGIEIPLVDIPEPPTETETFTSGAEPQPVAPPNPFVTSDLPSVDSETHETLSVNIDKICHEFHITRDKFKRVPAVSPTVGDVASDILDNEEAGEEPRPDSRLEDISSKSEYSAEQPNDRSESEESRSEFGYVRIDVDPPSSARSFSSPLEENSGLLAPPARDISEDSLDVVARERRISESTEDQQSEEIRSPVEEIRSPVEEIRSPVEEIKSPVEESSEKTSESSSGSKPKKKKKKNKKNKGNNSSTEQKESEEARSPEQQPNEQQNLPIVSEEIVEEPRFIKEEVEAENQAANTPPSGTNHSESEALRREPEAKLVKMKEKVENLKMKEEVQVRVLNLIPGNEESVLYRLEKNMILEFRMSPVLFGKTITIHCNFPAEKNGRLEEFDRKKYRVLEWRRDANGEYADDTVLYARIACKMAGTFHYYIVDENAEKKNPIKQSDYLLDHDMDCENLEELNKKEPDLGSGYFCVNPTLNYGENERLPLDAIQCQTVISKNLGSFSSWESKLRVSKETGYNLIHFTPVTELGASNSAYCLKDQLELNPSFRKENGEMPSWEELGALVEKMRKEWKVLSICDVVLNHTANESAWIREHEEATYNCSSCKYLRPAYLLDAALSVFEENVRKGVYVNDGVPPVIRYESDLQGIRFQLKHFFLKNLKLYELFICDVEKCVSEFIERGRYVPQMDQPSTPDNIELKIIQDPEYRRLGCTVDMKKALDWFYTTREGIMNKLPVVKRAAEKFRQALIRANEKEMDRVQRCLDRAVENVISGIRYWRVQKDGPRLGEITPENPLIGRYFTDYGTPKTMEEFEEIMYSDNGRFLMAHNGWVMDSDPLVNFAAPGSDVYFLRELIPWGDSVKLRYGEKPSDSPFLWDIMTKYVELTARTFHGVRLDNCHSTPFELAEYMMDRAKKVRPDLYVVAELFTNEERKDNLFINRLGITSLIREAMSANNADELGRLVYRFGGRPIGSFFRPNVCPLYKGNVAHALFFDQTHDNPSPLEKTSLFNMLPTAALVNMACCGSGSNRGVDELVPHQIDVVKETREYAEWSPEHVDDPKYTSVECGLVKVKKMLNDLHFKLGNDGFDEVFVYQMNPREVIAVTRHCPNTHERYITVAYTAFCRPQDCQPNIENLKFEGVLEEILLEATLSHVEFSNGGSKYANPYKYQKNDRYINGLTEYVLHTKEHIQLKDSEVLQEAHSENPKWTILKFKNFKPGSIIVLRVGVPKEANEAAAQLKMLREVFSSTEHTEIRKIVEKLDLSDLNRVLYRCDQEEREEGYGFDTYDVPGQGKLVYAGLQGFISRLSKVQNQGDPFCDNIRRGDWMIEYIYQRLKLDERTAELGLWIEKKSSFIKVLPEFLKPSYFDMFFNGIHNVLLEHSYNSMASFVKKGTVFVKALSMGSIQFAAYIRSAELPTLSPSLKLPKPPTRKDKNGEETQVCVSLSAGLPHFSVGYMRNWGRDTFIALRGLLLLTGRHQEARYHILAYAGCLRHGLIPNLLDGGRKPRYNCRDAVWWWLYCIKCYAEEVPNGADILLDEVSRLFPKDDSPAQQPGATVQTLQEVMQEAVSRHFQGVAFRERNAGTEIDEQMTDEGFNVTFGVTEGTGFVYGGNAHNCGTWMDKMGSSAKAGNKGKPATSRDGSACEIVGLSKCVVGWLADMHDRGLYKYEGVEKTREDGQKTTWTFRYWSDLIRQKFETEFWIRASRTLTEPRLDMINRRGIYKDSYGATQEWADYQLRCNYPIAMVVAPELFDPHNAWIALETIEKNLLGPLGVKTLDPGDWAYRADYDNSNDSWDNTVAHGFNYHQGPEWVWPIGFFLRAKLHFAKANNKLKETIPWVKSILSKHFEKLQESEWRGLPELTNHNGAECIYSSDTQAWSMSCVLEVLHDLKKAEESLVADK